MASLFTKLTLTAFVSGACLIPALPAAAFTISGQGAYTPSENAFTSTLLLDAVTIDFNDQTQGATLTNATLGSATYSTGLVGFGDLSGQLGEANKYLAISNSTTINLNGLNDYFGLYLGVFDTEDTIAFYNGNTQVGSFSGATMGNSCSSTITTVYYSVPLSSGPAGGFSELSCATFMNFTAENSGEYFNKIVMTAGSTSAFNSDNHAFRGANGPAGTAVPVPPAILGTVVTAGLAALKGRKSKQAAG
jgi:hypothetical protein